MKKRLNIVLAAVTAVVVAISGCGLDESDTDAAQEFVNDEIVAEESSSEDAASDSSLVVVKGLFEPALEESSASASTSTVESADDAAAEASSEAKEDGIIMVFMGDSQFANGRSDGTDLASLVAQRVPGAVAYNLGIGGTTASLERSTSEISPEKMTSNCFVGMAYALAGIADRNAVLANYPDVLDTMNRIDPAAVDYYFIEYGTNDFFKEVPLDHTQYDGEPVYTYYDAMCLAISTLKKISPHAQFIVMTPFYGIYKDANDALIGDSYVVSNGIGTMADYARKSQNVASDEKAIDFDGMFKSHCDLYIDTSDQYLIDGVHLSLTGRQIFARLLAHIPNWSEHYEPYAYMENDFINIAEFNPDEYYRYRDDMLKEYYPEAYEKMMNGEYLLAQPQ